MWRDIILIEKIAMTQKVNVLLYFLRMLPWIGKKIPEHLYASITLKQVLAWLAFIGTLLMGFVMKATYIAFFVILPGVMISEDGGSTTFCVVYLYCVLSGFMGPLLNDSMTRPAKKDYVMIQLMHMDAKRYVLANWFIYAIIQASMHLIALMVIFLLEGESILYPLLMIGISFGLRLFGNVYHLYHGQRRGKPFSWMYSCSIFVLLGGLAYGGAYVFRASTYQLPMLFGMLVVMVGGLIIAHHLHQKTIYDTTMRTLIMANRGLIDGSLQKAVQAKDVEIRTKDISSQDLEKHNYQDKKGYAYLNALFFQRHKRLFFKPMRNRIIGIIVIFFFINYALYFLKEGLTIPPSPFIFLPPMVFVLYAISIGERVTRAMFYNCDVSLLHYGYYRQSDAILTNFKIRLRKIIALNGLLATLINIGFLSVYMMSGAVYTWMDILLCLLTIYALAIFFSVHHLCMYYLLQPYTGQLEMKSPMFGAISGIIYFVSYMAMKFDGSILFTLIVLSATILYSIIALVLVWKKAPKTFHIR